MKLLLARHGNTFEATESARWIGIKEDLPLTLTGKNQALKIGKYLAQKNILLHGAYCSPLRRVSESLDLILQALSNTPAPVIDTRLNEIDYGQWGGLTTAEITQQFGHDAILQWETQTAWQSHWGESITLVTTRVQDFTQMLLSRYPSNATILLVSSNGLLRFFLTLVPQLFATFQKTNRLKVQTGHLCQLQFVNHQWQCDFWNQRPE